MKPYFLFALFVEVYNENPRRDYLIACRSNLHRKDIQFFRPEIEEIYKTLDKNNANWTLLEEFLKVYMDKDDKNQVRLKDLITKVKQK